MTPGPDYYRLADGRQFYEYSRDELVPMCKGLDPWDVHCTISAAEHYFRMGAKEGEYDTDLDANDWWVNRVSAQALPRVVQVMDVVGREREKVGR
jgi:hypothetical protein